MQQRADASVAIQVSAHSVPCPPPWFGEIVLIATHLRKQGVLATIGEQVKESG